MPPRQPITFRIIFVIVAIVLFVLATFAPSVWSWDDLIALGLAFLAAGLVVL